MGNRVPCGQCVHGGTQWRWKWPLRGTALHCEHQNPDVAFGVGQHDGKLPFSGWASLRNWYDTCKHGERKP